MEIIDFHSHTVFSDGALLPSELARRADILGYKVLGITDHVDVSNFSIVVPAIIKFCSNYQKYFGMKLIPGAEITHVPPQAIQKLAKEIRNLGAKIILVHGETIVEPVAKGTNICALQSDINILAHPGLITEEEVKLAKKKNIFLEISGKAGHSLTNGHVAKLAKKIGANLSFGSDTHSPSNLVTKLSLHNIFIGAGLSKNEIKKIFSNMQKLIKRLE
ncbi:MAG: histidinol phosphate phosphatase domain-containing protein [Candidatus Firestonebacteria bacterium]